jgi:hypothetical protein
MTIKQIRILLSRRDTAQSSSPGGSGQKCWAMSVGPDNPVTAYGRGHQGPKLPVLEVEVPLRSSELSRAAKGGPLNLFRWNK